MPGLLGDMFDFNHDGNRMDTLYRKDDIIEGLSRIYMKRSPDSPYIPCEEA